MGFDTVIVGAGASGLTAAAYLAKYGHSVLLCEKEAYCGGLINSFTRDGFTFDGGIRALEDAGVFFTMLRHLGVADPVWLEALRCHHHRTPGPLSKKTEAQQMARLLQRADIFGARLAPRAARLPMPVTAAMQASYYDEEHQVDEAGAALVKTLGVYPPGAFVRLASREVGVVIRRGTTATTPRVAVVTNRDGMPTGEPIPRDTRLGEHKVAAPLALHEVRLQVSLQRLAKLP